MEQDYKDLKNCELCQKKFTLTKRPHKCKRCKLIICADCGKTKAIILNTKTAPDVPHRVCSVCSTDIASQKEIIDTYNVSWAMLSPLGREWLKDCDVQKELSIDIQTEYKKNLQEAEKNVDPSLLILDIKDGKADREFYNYSMLEFLNSLQQQKDREWIRKNVENVLLAFYNRYPSQGHVTFLINVAVFLLCFTDEASAFGLLCFLNEKLLPKAFWNKNSDPIPFVGLEQENYILNKLTQEAFKANDENVKLMPFQITFRKVSDFVIGSLMVDSVNFNTLLYVWTQVFAQKSLIPIEAGIIKLFKLSKPYFDQHYNLSLYNFRVYACRNIQASNLRDDYVIQVNQQQRDELAQEFTEKIIDQRMITVEKLNTTLHTLKQLSTDDLNKMKKKIDELIKSVKTNKKQVLESVEFTQPTFINILKEAPALQTLDENTLEDIFESLDIDKLGYVTSRVFLGVLNLSIPPTLPQKLSQAFGQFDSHNSKSLSAKEIPPIVSFLAEVLAIFNAADPSYVNFNVDLYEMIEKVKKKVKDMDKVTLQDFESITSKYAVFQVLGGERRNSPRRSNSLLSFVSMGDNRSDRALSMDQDLRMEELEEVLKAADISPIREEVDAEQNTLNVPEVKETHATEEVKATNLSSSVIDQDSPKHDNSFEILKADETKGKSPEAVEEPEEVHQNVVVTKVVEQKAIPVQNKKIEQPVEVHRRESTTKVAEVIKPVPVKIEDQLITKVSVEKPQEPRKTPEQERRDSGSYMKAKESTLTTNTQAGSSFGDGKNSTEPSNQSNKIIVEYDASSEADNSINIPSGPIKATINAKDASEKNKEIGTEPVPESSCQMCSIF